MLSEKPHLPADASKLRPGAHIFMLNLNERSFRLLLLLVQLHANACNCLFLASNLVCLLLYMIPELTQLLFAKTSTSIISSLRTASRLTHEQICLRLNLAALEPNPRFQCTRRTVGGKGEDVSPNSLGVFGKFW
jgi:hypothetical protein